MKKVNKLRDDKAVLKSIENTHTSYPNTVEINAKYDNLVKQISINNLPTEILFDIVERLDTISIFHCYFVCKRWRSIVFGLIEKNQSKMICHFLYRKYQMEAFYQEKNSHCLMNLQKYIGSSLNWNYKCSMNLSISVPVIDAVQMKVYRDNVILITSEGVKYFDQKTFKIKKTIYLDKCSDFIENDYMVATAIKYDNGEGYALQLFGKSSCDDCQWESQITTCGKTEIRTRKLLDVRVFKVEDNQCFVVLKSHNTLYSYDWNYSQNPMEWHKLYRCRYYGGMGEVIAMDLGLRQIYLLTSSGELFCYQRARNGVITKVYKFAKFMLSCFVQLTHKCSLVLSVPDDWSYRITRVRKTTHPTLYRLELPKLTCVTEHGIILFLGFSDGKVKVLSPMSKSREHMFKHCIDLSVFKKEPPAPVVSIAVHVGSEGLSLFVATTSCVYRLIPTFPDEKNLWDKENRVSLTDAPMFDVDSI